MRIFIGYDPREAIAFHVLAHSIMRRASRPVTITPLIQKQLRDTGIYTRERGSTESTEFSLTRFLVPYLSNYEGISIFMDCDMLCLTDIHNLTSWIAENQSVLVVQHDYTPSTKIKMDGQIQTVYPRKNWSSFMVFNNNLCTELTPEYVNEATGLDLHRFEWASSIGSLPIEWNWLVGEYYHNLEAKILHYTLGGPWFDQYRDCDHSKEWLAELKHLTDY